MSVLHRQMLSVFRPCRAFQRLVCYESEISFFNVGRTNVEHLFWPPTMVYIPHHFLFDKFLVFIEVWTRNLKILKQMTSQCSTVLSLEKRLRVFMVQIHSLKASRRNHNFFSLCILTMASFWLLLTLGDVIDQTQNIKKYHYQPNYHPLIIQ